MAMLQHYYTSANKGTAGIVGFQCKAKSPGITSEELRTVNNIIGYRIPPTLDEYDIARHPMALRYAYLGPERCILACSQSCGTDESERPGNFFAHSMITSPQDFAIYAPIMYWRHEFWKTSDRSDRLEIPAQPAFKEQPSLQFDRIWSFLDTGVRRDWFHGLLCAVIQREQSKRPIVILDDADNVALWIATVTFALPAMYRPVLTFATYHHDPYQVPFWITGTTNDSMFRFSSDEYISHFVINTESGRISETGGSAYADWVCQHFQPDSYESLLLDFFQFCGEYLPSRPGNLAQRLDSATYRFQTIRSKTLAPSSPAARRSLKEFALEIETRPAFLEHELADVISGADALRQAIALAPSPELVGEYGCYLNVLRQHDDASGNRCASDLELASRFLLQGHEAISEPLFSVLGQAYSKQDLQGAASRIEFLRHLDSGTSDADWQIHYAVWTQLGPLFQVDSHTEGIVASLIQKTLAAVDGLPSPGPGVPAPEAQKVLSQMIRAIGPQYESLLIESAIAQRRRSQGASFSWLYCILIGDLTLADRERYRTRIHRAAPDIAPAELVSYEIECDLVMASDNPVPKIEEWVTYAAGQPDVNRQMIVSKGLDILWHKARQVPRSTIAEQVLISDALKPHLNTFWKEKLISTYLSRLKIKRLSPETLHLYEEFFGLPGLDDDQRALIGGSLAMSTEQFAQGTQEALQSRLARQDQETYRQEAGSLISRFFAEDITLDSHIQMLLAVYVGHHSRIFWDIYWSNFQTLLRDSRRAKQSVDLLSFWFDESLVVFEAQPYLGQSFFMQLPSVLDDIRGTKGFNEAATRIGNLAVSKPWYSLIHEYLTGKVKGIFGLLGRK